MGLKGKVLNKKTEKPADEEEFDYEDHGLDPEVDDLDLDFDDEELNDEPVATKPSGKKGKATEKTEKKSAKTKAKAAVEDEADDLALDDLEIDDIDGDDLEALAHADLTTSDLQGKGQSTALDVLSPILDRIGTLEEHVDVHQDNTLNRLKSVSGEIATVINNQAVQAKEIVEIKDMLGAVLGRITALEQCFRTSYELDKAAKKGTTKEVVPEEPPKVEKKTAKATRPPLPDACGDAEVRFVLTIVNKASGPVDYSKLTSALARKWVESPDKVKAIPGLLSHLGYKPGEKAVPGQFTYDKYKP